MKIHYKKLYNMFTFKIPKIVFINKSGNIINEKDINNINYYKKNVYIYNPNLKIFEKKILSSLLKDINKDINIGIITHGKFIKQELLYLKGSKKGYNHSSNFKKYIITTRKFDNINHNIETNNCDTYLKKYIMYKKNINQDKKCKQIFPSKNELNYYDNYLVPYYNLKIKNKKIIEQLLKNKNFICKQKNIKYIFGFYYQIYKNKILYFKKLIKLYYLFLAKNKNK